MATLPKVGVAVTLYDEAGAGGHVKVWLRWAEAIVERPDSVDLTLYFLGDVEEVVPLADHVRIHRLPPVKGTRQRPWLSNGGGDTDLATDHPLLAQRCSDRDILHATDTFSFGHVFRRLGREGKARFIASMHTDLAMLTPIYAREIIGRMLGGTVTSGLFACGLGRVLGASALKKTVAFQRPAEHLFLAPGRDWAEYRMDHGPDRTTDLRRGVDRDAFNPDYRDPERLRAEFGIPDGKRIVLFAGRVDRTKNAPLAAEAVAGAVENGCDDLHMLVLGRGGAREAIKERLGDTATVPGPVSQAVLGRAMASSDLFLFPSVTEISGNVVQEALACGLPVMTHARDGTTQFHTPDLGQGMLVDSDDPTVWSGHLIRIFQDPDTLPTMAAAARRWAQDNALTWGEVMEQDLLPVWRRMDRSPAEASN